MEYGLCNLSIVPLRLEASDTSEMISQVLYGEIFKIIELRKKWSHIQLASDGYEGWIDNLQYIPISEEEYILLNNKPLQLSANLVDIISTKRNELISVCIGSNIAVSEFLQHSFEGETTKAANQGKSNLINTAYLFLNSPYLWGGKTPFGIDCSGFTQIVYKLNGINLLRDASLQATQGEPLSFIEESEPGDLAFFDNEDGKITHVGIILKDHHIIHAHGKVRIDRLDQSGIFNIEKKVHTHKLRVIKRIY